MWTGWRYERGKGVFTEDTKKINRRDGRGWKKKPGGHNHHGDTCWRWVLNLLKLSHSCKVLSHRLLASYKGRCNFVFGQICWLSLNPTPTLISTNTRRHAQDMVLRGRDRVTKMANLSLIKAKNQTLSWQKGTIQNIAVQENKRAGHC
jgi:hypothetical protein